MASAQVSRGTKLALSASVITNLVMGSFLLYVNGPARFTDTATFDGVITVQQVVNQSGGVVPFSDSIVFTENSSCQGGVGSGNYIFTNPVDYPILCRGLTVDTTTGRNISADVFYSTGTSLTTQGCATGTTIANNFSFGTAGTLTLTGSDLTFKLAASSSTTANKSIIFATTSGTSINVSDFATLNAFCVRKQ